MVRPPRLAATLAELRINPNELLPEQVLPFVSRPATWGGSIGCKSPRKESFVRQRTVARASTSAT